MEPPTSEQRLKVKKEDIETSFLFFSSHLLDNQVLAESRVRLKEACVEANSAGVSAPRSNLGSFDTIQAWTHLLTCP